MFSYVSPERRIPATHPLRPIREMTDEVLRDLSRRFAGLYAKTARPSIAPEKLLRALLLQVLYSVRSERLLMEQLEYNLLFRWFVGLSMDDRVWDVTVFTKNRERLLRGDIAEAFFARVLALAEADRLLSDEHFSVDGTLIQAWAGQKSFQRKGSTPRRRTIPEILWSTSTARSGRTPRTPRSRTPTRSSTRRRRATRRS
jgi:transposase